MHAIVTCKYEMGRIKTADKKWQHRFSHYHSLWELYVAMETRVLIRSGSNPNAALSLTPMMLSIKFHCDRPADCGDIHVWKCEQTHPRTHGRTDGRRLDWYTISSSAQVSWKKKKIQRECCKVNFNFFASN